MHCNINYELTNKASLTACHVIVQGIVFTGVKVILIFTEGFNGSIVEGEQHVVWWNSKYGGTACSMVEQHGVWRNSM